MRRNEIRNRKRLRLEGPGCGLLRRPALAVKLGFLEASLRQPMSVFQLFEHPGFRRGGESIDGNLAGDPAKVGRLPDRVFVGQARLGKGALAAAETESSKITITDSRVRAIFRLRSSYPVAMVSRWNRTKGARS